MPTSLPVKWLASSMQGAPQMTNNFGDMINVLDAALVNGFNVRSVGSITRSGSLATMNIPSGHLFIEESVVRVVGADQDEYNGDKRVISRTGTAVTFEVTGSPATPATGTITVRQAPLGFEKAFSGTNKAAYRSLNPLSLKPYLRVDNSQHPSWVTGRAIVGKVHTGMTMTDVDTFVGDYSPYDSNNSFPDWGWFKWYQSYSQNGGPNALNSSATNTWTIVGDDRCFYFIVLVNNSSYAGSRLYGWGELNSFKPNDPAPVFFWASENYNESNTSPNINLYGPQSSIFGVDDGNSPTTSGQRLLKSFTGIGGDAATHKFSLNTKNDGRVKSGHDTGVTWPNGPDLSLILHPAYASENQAHLRGMYPGLFCIHNNLGNQIPHLRIIDTVSGYPNRKFIVVTVIDKDNTNNNNGRVAFDITGPWR